MKTNLFQTIDIKTVPLRGMTFDLTATPSECVALADRFDVPAVHSFSLHGHICGSDVICFEGHFTAALTRQCVVSLEAFETTVSGKIKEYFSQNGTDFHQETDFDIDMDKDDVNLLLNGRLDIGEIAAEHFGLNLEPFPHKPGVAFCYENTSVQRDNPFSVLKKLIKK
ncbi:MAG: YceD family protein [Alphaproteobacteria bacterium]